jgi:phosphopantothenoylcysteine decarboxylase/phosphopantothenate--cysteine ligase
MGYELAKEAKRRKYKVTLISGRASLKPPAGIKFLRIETTRQLYEKVHRELGKNDILVMSSAVSDFRPVVFSKNKIKSRKNLTLKLVKNPDILKSIPAGERKNKIIAGFSLETKDLLKNASKKLKAKRLDLVIANKSDRKSAPFGKGAKTVYILDRLGVIKKLKNMNKARIASAILDTIDQLCYTPN